MALLVDGNLTTIEELDRYDSSVLQVAHIESLNLSGIIELTGDDVRMAIERELSLAAVATGTRPHSIEQTVVSEPMRRWHLLRVLEHACGIL